MFVAIIQTIVLRFEMGLGYILRYVRKLKQKDCHHYLTFVKRLKGFHSLYCSSMYFIAHWFQVRLVTQTWMMSRLGITR